LAYKKKLVGVQKIDVGNKETKKLHTDRKKREQIHKDECKNPSFIRSEHKHGSNPKELSNKHINLNTRSLHCSPQKNPQFSQRSTITNPLDQTNNHTYETKHMIPLLIPPKISLILGT